MKRIEEKLKRKVKYWRVSFYQAGERQRLHYGLYGISILIFMWWYILGI